MKEIRDIWNKKIDLLVEQEEYELAGKTKRLVEKLDLFIRLKEVVKDQELYKEVEKIVIKELSYPK